MERTILLLLVGLGAGTFGGALGMSAATVIVPAILLLGIVKSYKTAIGTAILTIMPPLSILALVKYYKEGLVDVHAALLLMGGAIIGAGLGAHLTVHHSTEQSIAHVSAAVYGVAALAWLYLGRQGVAKKR